MNKLLVIICLEMFMFSCFPVHKCNSNDNMEQINQQQVRDFAEIPAELLSHIEKMGVDSSSILNDYEGKYLNFIFKTDIQDFNLVEKKVGFIYSGAKSNKQEYFNLEKDRLNRNYTTNNGTLYIFNAEQKAESGDYDAAIVYWSKFLLPVEQVIKRLKNQR